ncbi:MAG: hydroxysqualene dehydroxylase HpnE [Thermoguttaceae bacterium]|jgi:squalene-associated FAD-dependent desaturase
MSSTSPAPDPQQPSVAVIGGGVAGLAAAVAAVEQGFHVELFEQAPTPGGRAGSYHDVQADQLVDLSPHVAMGCCTNLLDLCRRTETADGFRRYATLHFFGPDGTRYDFAASRWFPAPLHLMPGLRRLGYLTGRDRRAIGWGMLRLARHCQPDTADSPTMGEWLRRRKQPENAVRRFWAVVLESALGDTIDHVSVAAARKVFVDGFMATREAYEVLVPWGPLGAIWQRVGTWLTRRGAKLHMRTRIERLEVDGKHFLGIVLADGLCRRFDHVVSAVSWKQLDKLLGPALLKQIPLIGAGTGLYSSPITAVHLWFDRPIIDLPHAALVGRLSQWVFQGSWHVEEEPAIFHYTVVISASHGLIGRESRVVLQEVLGDLRAIWPVASEANLVYHRVLTQQGAVFSPRPGIDAARPAQQTPIEGLYLAGDWTATDWPATMEGAVRSGYLAIEAVLATLGRPGSIVVPSLKKGWLMKWIAR